MLLGFKDQFHPMISDGSKQHTIRAKRKVRPKAGETCHCYGKIRQKGMHLLGRWPCVRVEEIVIRRSDRPGVPLCVEIDGQQLSPDETNTLFHRDGFRPETYRGNLRLQAFRYPSIEMAAEFWKERAESFVGDIIHWDFSRRLYQRGDMRPATATGDLCTTYQESACRPV